MPVTIYEHANYQGRSQVLAKGQYDNALGQISIGNDTLSSIKVSSVVRGITYAYGHAAVVGLSEVHNPDPVNNPGPPSRSMRARGRRQRSVDGVAVNRALG